MLILIVSELKSKFKNPITWFIIIILCTLSGFTLLEAQSERVKRPFVEHDIRGMSSTYGLKWSESLINEKQKSVYPVAYESLKLYDSIILNAGKATSAKDYLEAIRLFSFWNLVCLKMDNLSTNSISDIMLKNDIYEMWLDVSNGITYESVDFRPVIDGGKKENHELLSAKYYHNLYINEIEPIYNDESNNVTALYGYFFKVVPIMLFIVIILFVYNSISKEKRAGTLKLILTQSINRSRFYISKWLSSVIHIVVMFLIPPVLISTIAGFLSGFVTLKYPTFYLSNVFTRLKPIENYFDIVEREYKVPELLSRVFGHIAPGYRGYKSIIEPHADIDIIPFYQYLLIAILLLSLFIMFAVAFVQLISAIIDNELISLITTSVLVGGLTYISLPFTQERAYNLSPFTFFKISRIIEGTYNVTVLTSVLVMIVSTLVLLFLGCKYFRRKEI